MSKLKAFLNSLFGKNVEMPATFPANDSYEEERIEVDDPHHLMSLMYPIKGGNYHMTKPDPNARKVYLTNPQDCRYVKALDLIAAWSGSGHCEWECVWALFFCRAVDEALKNGMENADLTSIFSRDYLAFPDKVFSKEKTWSHVTQKYFDVVSESDDEIYLKARVRTPT